MLTALALSQFHILHCNGHQPQCCAIFDSESVVFPSVFSLLASRGTGCSSQRTLRALTLITMCADVCGGMVRG